MEIAVFHARHIMRDFLKLNATSIKVKEISISLWDANPEIITEEQFNKVQEERSRRSNTVKDENGTTRKSTHYSSKRKER